MIAHIIPAKRGTLRLGVLDYLVPPELEGSIQSGQLVTIPLRSKEEFGVVLRLNNAAEVAKGKLKTLTSLVAETPVLSAAQLAFLAEMSELYHTSLGFLLKTNLLPLQKRKLKTLRDCECDTNESNPGLPKKPILATYANEEDKREHFSKVLNPDDQTLIIVSEVHEIALIQKTLPEAVLDRTITITSDLSTKDMFDAWIAVWSGKKTIVIGTRTALFLPFAGLKTIIIDNEGSESHKSWDMAPRFHAREAALILAKYHGAQLHILAHTPSVETYYFAKHQVYNVAGTLLPQNEIRKYHIRNVREERRGGNYTHLSTDILEAIERGKGTIFLFCHRRGTMSHVSCRDCGEVLTCPKCSRSLTFHHHTNRLVCHQCAYSQAMVATCASCGGASITLFGAGVDAIAGQLGKILPNEKRPIITIDQDKDAPTLPEGDCIIVGTHFAWNHVPWEKITTMAFVDADTLLFIPEYRLAERLWNEMREANYLLPPDAELYIQTTHPEHPVFMSLYQPDDFYISELNERKTFKYPPYQYLLKVSVGGLSEAKSRSDIDKVYEHLLQLTKQAKNATVLKPFAPTPQFQKGQFWHTILIKLPYNSYKQYWRLIVSALPESCKVDPNPLSIFSL